jgi:hypothetical protein
MACRLIFIRDNHHCPSRPRSGGGQIALSGQMVTISDQLVSLFVLHSIFIPNHTNMFLALIILTLLILGIN